MIYRFDLKLLNASRTQFGLNPLVHKELTDALARQALSDTKNAAYHHIQQGGCLPEMPFYEEHPYDSLVPFNTAFPTTILGTFPPPTYLSDSNLHPGPITLPNGTLLGSPLIPFYHGNLGSMWDLIDTNWIDLPVSNRHAAASAVQTMLTQLRINYVDVIKGTQRRPSRVKGKLILYPSSDSAYRNIRLNEERLNQLIASFDGNTLLITNSSSTFSTKGVKLNSQGEVTNSGNRAFDFLLQHMQYRGHSLAISFRHQVWMEITLANRTLIQQQLRTKVAFFLRVNDVIVSVVTPPSPSNWTNLTIPDNPCYHLYIQQRHSGYQNTPMDFKRYIYRQALARNLAALWPLNV